MSRSLLDITDLSIDEARLVLEIAEALQEASS